MSEQNSLVHIPVIDPLYQGYFYVGHGDHCVILCDVNIPKWRNGSGLTSENARKLAEQLIRAADYSEAIGDNNESED